MCWCTPATWQQVGWGPLPHHTTFCRLKLELTTYGHMLQGVSLPPHANKYYCPGCAVASLICCIVQGVSLPPSLVASQGMLLLPPYRHSQGVLLPACSIDHYCSGCVTVAATLICHVAAILPCSGVHPILNCSPFYTVCVGLFSHHYIML